MLGRQYERRLIQSHLNSKRAELGIVYGRRRVGKSTLLHDLRKENAKDLYFEGIRGLSTQDQISHFCKQLAKQTKSMQVIAHTWQDAFDALTMVIEKGKFYIVFDEFPWMAHERQGLVNILKYYWDNHWKKNPRVKLILCGSIAQFMVNHLIHSQALHNRKTFELKIDPLPCDEAALFFKSKRSKFEITKFLMIFGGIPKYLEQVNPNHSLSKNLDYLCFQKGGFFLNEFETIFKEQFRVIKQYQAVVKFLSKEKLTKEEIAKKLKTSTGGGLTTCLTNLEQAEFIRKECSLGFDKNKKEKTVHYALSDEWLRFYFNYMEPTLARIKSNTSDGLFDKITASSLANYFGLSFENFCFKNINTIIKALEIKPEDVLDYGPYFKQASRGESSRVGVQIDLLIQCRGNNFILVECKYKEDPVDASVIKEIESRIKALKIPTKVTLEKVLIAANGVTSAVVEKDYFHKIITLEDIL